MDRTGKKRNTKREKGLSEQALDLRSWPAPDPFNPYPYLAYVWWCETGPSAGQYLNADAQPIFFAGTDPRHPGYPPPEVENDVGTPREQWERVNGPLE